MIGQRQTPPDGTTCPTAAATAVATHGFGLGPVLPGAPLGDDQFVRFLSMAQRDRLIGAVAQVVSEGAFPVTRAQRRSLADMHERWLQHTLKVERLLLRVGECLESAGIDFRVLKGAALAHVIYSDPSWRVFGDLDLLIPSEKFDAAVQLASSHLGGVQPVPELRPGFDRRFGKEALIRIDGIELDLHRTFVTGAFGLTVELDRLFDGGTPFRVGGQVFNALDTNALFLHCCYNLALGDYPVRLCSLRDQLLAFHQLDIQLDAVIGLAREWRATAVLRRASQLIVAAIDVPSGHQLSTLATLSVPRSEAWLLRSYLSSARSYSRPLASLAVIPGIGPKVRYSRALLFPSKDYLDSRGWTKLRHWRLARDRLVRRG